MMYTIISEKTETRYININKDTQTYVFILTLYIKLVFGRDFNINAEFFRVDGEEVLSVIFHQENGKTRHKQTGSATWALSI